MADSLFFTVLQVLAILTAVALFVSPLPDLRRIHMTKVIGEVSVLPLLSMWGCASIWVIYGFMTSSVFPVVVTNAIGMFCALSYIVVYWRHTTEKKYVMKLFTFVGFGLACITLYAVLAASGVTNQTNKQAGKIIGFVADAVNIILYASPFETMKKIVQTKNSSSLPISFCFVTMINCTLWVLYGIIDNDMFVLTPNALGFVFSVIQVTLYVKYKSSASQVQIENEARRVSIDIVTPKENDSFAYFKTKSPTLEPSPTTLAPVSAV
uniref:Sugar transporter SWEET1 n=1 Tax=Globisporangium ultimum (strain ATCC 200006 / CBS 805.95 / DAOM BR144) TaxID=431595 RepID=K3X1W4_GLOUD